MRAAGLADRHARAGHAARGRAGAGAAGVVLAGAPPPARGRRARIIRRAAVRSRGALSDAGVRPCAACRPATCAAPVQDASRSLVSQSVGVRHAHGALLRWRGLAQVAALWEARRPLSAGYGKVGVGGASPCTAQAAAQRVGSGELPLPPLEPPPPLVVPPRGFLPRSPSSPSISQARRRLRALAKIYFQTYPTMGPPPYAARSAVNNDRIGNVQVFQEPSRSVTRMS